jgi:hypothetical protein
VDVATGGMKTVWVEVTVGVGDDVGVSVRVQAGVRVPVGVLEMQGVLVFVGVAAGAVGEVAEGGLQPDRTNVKPKTNTAAT